jgi:hypothetical protein
MRRLSESVVFERTISQLIAKREEHARGLAEIDALCNKYGIKLNGAKSATASTPRSATGSRTKRRKRQRFDQTAEEFVLSLLKGGKGMTTAEVNAHWKKSGRGGVADNALGSLVKARKLKRVPVNEGRGSNYSVA